MMRKILSFFRLKLIGLLIIAFSSFIDGALEGYQFDGRKSFERKYNVSPESFFGSKSWASVYVDGNPDLGFKSWLLKQTGAIDFYHVADDIRKWGYIIGGGTYAVGTIGKGKIYIDVILVGIVSASFKRLGLYWIRS